MPRRAPRQPQAVTLPHYSDPEGAVPWVHRKASQHRSLMRLALVRMEPMHSHGSKSQHGGQKCGEFCFQVR